jgi:DNA-binding transcriptional regulator LsrR (DeoR family)
VTHRPGPELLELIGEAALVRLAEAFGGTRLFVPVKMTPEHEIAQAIGIEAARALSARLAPDYIKVPLARAHRARQYRAAGRSNAQIARALGITETGVEGLFRRMAQVPRKGSAVDERQGNLFT